MRDMHTILTKLIDQIDIHYDSIIDADGGEISEEGKRAEIIATALEWVLEVREDI